MSTTERLSTQLEYAALRAVAVAYRDLNATFFKHRLRLPTFEFTDTSARLGRWVHEGRRLELSRSLLFKHGWGVLVEVLKHEMAHQFADEVLGASDEVAHGPTFRRVCEERGFDARATGIPTTPEGGPKKPILERISKLLALADSPNEHEAQAAMNAAQRLMLKYNIEEVLAGRGAACSYRHLGKPTGRVSEAERVLANILSDHFFVDAIWVPVWRAAEGKRGSILEVCGRLENLEMAEYVYSFLTHTAARLWEEHKRREKVRGNADRRAYVAGVMSGFRTQLAAQESRDNAAGLVWVGDPEVGDYFKKRHPFVRWTRHVSSRGSHAHSHGVEAGKRIILHRGVTAGPSGPTRLLKR